MPCIYENKRCGTCTISTDGDDKPITDNMQNGCDEDAVCVVGDDPDPSVSCDGYESDYTCSECGVDLNVEDCECED